LRLCWLVAGLFSGAAQAHGFEERYDLPVPLPYVIAAACAVVLLTFVLAIFFMRSGAVNTVPEPKCKFALLAKAHPLLFWFIRLSAWCLGLLVLSAALLGTSDPLMNLAPTFVWIIWWVGLGFLVVFFGDFWPWLDPWATTFDVLEWLAKRLFGIQRLTLGWRWPPSLGVW
jgi:hypothetical protein